MTWDNIISRSIWTFLQPSNFLLIILLISMLLFIFSNSHSKRKANALKVNITGLIIFLFIGTTNLASWVMWPLEGRFNSVSYTGSYSGIIVLGGSEEGEISTYHSQSTLNGGSERLYQAAKLAILYPELPIIHSGGVRNNENEWSESDVAKMFFRDVSIKIERIRFDRKSYNTYSNAIESKKLIRANENQSWLLVTSAYHMPRAITTFQKVGIQVTPYPTDYKTPFKYNGFFNFEVADNFKILDLAVHEYIGLIAYYVTGRSSSIIPATQ